MQSNCLASKNLLVNVGLDNANGKVKYLSTYVFIRGCGWAANLSWLAFVHIPRRGCGACLPQYAGVAEFSRPCPARRPDRQEAWAENAAFRYADHAVAGAVEPARQPGHGHSSERWCAPICRFGIRVLGVGVLAVMTLRGVFRRML